MQREHVQGNALNTFYILNQAVRCYCSCNRLKISLLWLISGGCFQKCFDKGAHY